METQDCKTLRELEDALLVDLCCETGEVSPNENLFQGACANHDPEDIAEAACRDVAALVRLRIAFGLPIFS